QHTWRSQIPVLRPGVREQSGLEFARDSGRETGRLTPRRAAVARKLLVYDSSDRPPRIVEEARGLWDFRNLVRELVVRDIKARYKRSVLGILWTMLAPLLNMIVLTLVF